MALRNSTRALPSDEGTCSVSVDLSNRAVVRKRVDSLKPSPENSRLYDHESVYDEGIATLAQSIKKVGLQHNPIVTKDNYIISGHRRVLALQKLGRGWVKCEVIPIRRFDMDPDEYLSLIRECNRQRHKSVAEEIREEMLDINPAEAHASLDRLRNRSVYASTFNNVPALEIEGTKRRWGISEAKKVHVEYILKVIEGRKQYWPLTVRGVHYPLLNYDFIRGHYWPRKGEPDWGTRRELRYRNDDGSYQATSELLTRLRLLGRVQWNAITDGTRPAEVFRPFDDARAFVRQEIEGLFAGYWRNLIQSQPNHIEVVCEKNTIYHMVLRVTRNYQITTSSGRGFNSIDPWHEMYQRYEDSGRERLIVIILSDFDPEGEMIPHVCGRTMRDDFHIPGDKLTIIKAGVTREQAEKYSLPAMTFAKETSSNRDWFLERNGGDDTVWELEALEPATMLADLEATIQGVLDIDLFNREIEKEREESVYLKATRQKVAELLRDI